MCYGEFSETKCPDPKCGEVFERLDYARNPPPVPMTPRADWFFPGEHEHPLEECPSCGTSLEDAFEVLVSYRAARTVFLAAAEKADEAWNRWFAKRSQGVATNGAAAQRLGNLANYATADLYSAEGKLWSLEIDPRDVCIADGVDPASCPATA